MSLTPIEWLTLSLVGITGFYAWATYRILKVNEAIVEGMRHQQIALSRAYIQIGVFLRPGTPMICLSIKNCGRSSAKNLALSLDRSFHSFARKGGGYDLAKMDAFSSPIESMPPGMELVFNLAVGPDLFGVACDESLTPVVFAVTAKYDMGFGVVSEKTTIDLRPYRSAAVVYDPVAYELEKIRKVIERMSK